MNENDEIADSALEYEYIHCVDVSSVTPAAEVNSASTFRVKVAHHT
jgi:hypothetical protein